MIKKTTYIISLLIITLSLSSCIKYQEVQMVKVTDISLKSISEKGVKFNVSMQIKNPNTYKISVVGSDLDLFIKGEKVGKVILDDKITLPKKSNEIHHFTFSSDYTEIFTNPTVLLGSILGGNQIEIVVKGHIKARAKGISKKFPVEFSEKIKM